MENSLETLEKGSFIGIRRGEAVLPNVYGHFLHIVKPMVQKYWSFIEFVTLLENLPQNHNQIRAV